VEASRYFPAWQDVDYIVAAPYARGTMGYQGVAEQDVLDVLADVKRRFPVDDNRVYLTGLSMGGGGTLWLGLTRPDLWAAIAPVCPAPPPGTVTFSPNALNLPVRIFQGGADPVVRPESVRAWVARLDTLGTRVEYTEYPGVDHFSWVPAYAEGQIFDWFARFQRDPHPDRVRFATDRYRYDRAYWVRLDGLTPGTPASIEAGFTGPNRIQVTTSGLDGFSFDLGGHPRFAAGDPLTVEIDGRRLRVPAGTPPAFNRQGGKWLLGAVPPRGKRPGAEGPMSEVLAGRHVYVYGTGGNPSPDELAARRARALKAAEWSLDRGPFWGRIMVFPRVLADREVRPSDLETANLVLFGTGETNSLIARFADRLPLRLEDPSGDYGLVYVYPVGQRYVLISSGLAWWEAGPGAAGSLFTGEVVAFGLNGLPDYVVFRRGGDQAMAQGRFDRDWQLAAADAEALRALGAVTVQPTGAAASGR
jgi:predicted esterase